MSLKKLLRRDIEPRCTYCAHGAPLAGEQKLTCRRRGVVDADFHCRAFRYDPLRRKPAGPAKLRGRFSDADFSMGDADET